ncbi:MAG: hypothetical protein J7M26_00465 [Armatimonadetes bacterium]|nr:hypothetical protein [Armatimonadota bacterium]
MISAIPLLLALLGPVNGGLDLAAEAPALLEKYKAWDASYNKGLGFSDKPSSGSLAWAEARFLRNYMMAYDASGDRYWLRKVVDHFDRMVANLSDSDGDGFLAWSDVAYSVGIARVLPPPKPVSFTVSPSEVKVWYRQGGKDFTGHTYRLQFADAKTLRVLDLTAGKTLATLSYHDGLVLDQIPGAKFKVKGTGRPRQYVDIITLAPQHCEFQVHDGMITYPIALFIETVWHDKNLQPEFKAKADAYAKLLHDHFLLKWERTWKNVGDAGLYCFTMNLTQRYPGYSLPHNQYLALARTWLVMADQPGVPDRDLYRERAVRMARYFKQHLQLVGNAYKWNYWDCLPGEGIRGSTEDYSHATIDISFVIEACKRGVVFTRKDMLRFARTWVDVMWDGNREKPGFGRNVGTKGSDKSAWWEWVQLGQFDRRAYHLAMMVFEASKQSTAMVPSILYLYRHAPEKFRSR